MLQDALVMTLLLCPDVVLFGLEVMHFGILVLLLPWFVFFRQKHLAASVLLRFLVSFPCIALHSMACHEFCGFALRCTNIEFIYMYLVWPIKKNNGGSLNEG